MIINTFTLLDAVNQFWKVLENGDRRSLTSAGLTYYYLCNVWNGCGRPISFRRQNTLICAELEVSKPTLERHRNILKQAGLIDFFSKGKGDPNITYKILEVIKLSYSQQKKENNITTPVTTPVTTGDCIKQSTEKEIFIVVEGEVKKLSYLKNLFESDIGLMAHWSRNDFAAEKFSDGVELWMIQNHQAKYPDFEKARKHFLYWIPSYSFELEKHLKKTSNGSNRNGAQHHKAGKSTGAGNLLDELRDEFTAAGNG